MFSWLAAGSTPMAGFTLVILLHFDVNGGTVYLLIAVPLSIALCITAAVPIFCNEILEFYAAGGNSAGVGRSC